MKISLPHPSVRKAKHGFTLTEIAIVLGVVGLVIGAIWVAASGTFSNMKVAKGQTEILMIANKIRSHFNNHMHFKCYNCDITATVAALHVFPSDMLSGPVVNGTVSTYPLSPWGTHIEVLNGNAGAPANAFYIQISSDPFGFKDCPALATSILNVANDSGLIGIWTTGPGFNAPVGAWPNYNLAAVAPDDPAIANCSNVGFLFTLVL